MRQKCLRRNLLVHLHTSAFTQAVKHFFFAYATPTREVLTSHRLKSRHVQVTTNKFWGFARRNHGMIMRRAVVVDSGLILTIWGSHNVHPMHSTRPFLHFAPIEKRPLRSGFDHVPSGLVAQRLSHYANTEGHICR